MAPLPSAFSLAARAIADTIDAHFRKNGETLVITTDAPANSKKQAAANRNLLNLFFYRFAPSGFHAAARSDQPLMLRLHCLITPFAAEPQANAPDQTGAGEADLMILGEVARLFHEQPVIGPFPEPPREDEHRLRYALQVVMQPLEMEEINHIWTTQGDLVYRPSLSYEFALVPVMPAGPPHVDSTVIGVSGEVHAGLAEAPAPGVAIKIPPVPGGRLGLAADGWLPAIAFLDQGRFVHALFERWPEDRFGAAGDPGTRAVAAAGAEGAEIRLQWDLWSADLGWEPHGDPVELQLENAILDPMQIGDASTVDIAVPTLDRPSVLALRGERDFAADEGGPAVRSGNRILLTVTREPEDEP